MRPSGRTLDFRGCCRCPRPSPRRRWPRRWRWLWRGWRQKGSPAQLAELEAEVGALPPDLGALLRTTDGLGVGGCSVPSVAEMREHWGYNDAYPPVFKEHEALPFGMLD